MKKKAVVAMLIMCMAVSAAACGKSSDTEKTTTETTDTKDSEDSEKDSTDTDTKETDSSGENRLVSVKDVSKYVTIGEYKGLELTRTSQPVTDDDVQAEINYNLEDNGSEVKDGTVENGDTVTINFTGTIDGKEFDGGSAEDYELVVGDGEMIDGFEDGIVGMKSGETKELDLTFPDDYYEESVAGKAVVFKVTLQKFTRPAELTDEWVAENTEYKTVDEYRAAVKTQLEDTAVQTADYELYSDAWNEVQAASEIKDYPKEDVDAAKKSYQELNEKYVKDAGMEMADFLESQGMSEEDYESECQQYAESKVEQNLIVQGIMDAEGLSIDDEETQKLKDDLIKEYGFASIDEMIETYGEQEVNESLALLRVERFIVDNANVTEVAGDDADAVDEGYDLEEYDESMDIDTGDDTEDNVDTEDAAAEDATDEVAEE
ncbi:trigger factor [Ruminococcus sp. AF17-22AC]|jgi:trigger factor|uniref:trigger factor n=1 Tax=Clostridia TaxID=186801 RepID=UPI00257066F0|nr:trigger factor [Ruminococcus sp. AF17-22AC]